MRCYFIWKKDIPAAINAYSNYGICNQLSIEMPLAESPVHLLYGSPKNYTGEYHTLLLSRTLKEEAGAFIDVGANWGYYSFFIASAPGKKIPIYAFEPNPILFEYLQKNIQQNKLTLLQVLDLAICDTTGLITFYQDKTSDLTSTIKLPSESDKFFEIQVSCTRLDDWILTRDLNNLLVKVDVENAEWNFISGVTGVLDKIKFLIMEVLGPARKSGFINYMIRESKWNAYYINKYKIEFVVEEDMRYTPDEYNWLFCRENPAALRILLRSSLFVVVE